MTLFFNDTATTEIYTLALHDALPIWRVTGEATVAQSAGVNGVRTGRPRASSRDSHGALCRDRRLVGTEQRLRGRRRDRKSTRLNSSHANISYAVFCLKKKQVR